MNKTKTTGKKTQPATTKLVLDAAELRSVRGGAVNPTVPAPFSMTKA